MNGLADVILMDLSQAFDSLNRTNLRTEYININFVNLSMSGFGTFGTSLDTFLQMLNDLNFKKNLAHHIL